MIIDASALLAIVLDEPDAARYARAIASDRQPRIPSVTWFEASMRIEAAADAVAISRFDDFPGDWRSWLAHQHDTLGVTGSSPVSPI